MKQKYIPNNYDKAIYHIYTHAFVFGDWFLYIEGDTLNAPNSGYSRTDKNDGYDIEGNVSPLTNQLYFTCSELEVFKIVY